MTWFNTCCLTLFDILLACRDIMTWLNTDENTRHDMSCLNTVHTCHYVT